MKRRKYIEADTRLPGEKRESKFARWLSDTKLAILLQIEIWKFQNYFRK